MTALASWSLRPPPPTALPSPPQGGGRNRSAEEASEVRAKRRRRRQCEEGEEALLARREPQVQGETETLGRGGEEEEATCQVHSVSSGEAALGEPTKYVRIRGGGRSQKG